MDMTDNELKLSLELLQTRAALCNVQSRALGAEARLAEVARDEINVEVRKLMVEQENRDKAAQAKAAEAATPTPAE